MRERSASHFVVLVVFVVILTATSAAESAHCVGVAQIDVTPDYPIRLSGFGNRRTESEGVTQRIRAKALAIDSGEGPAVLITVDSLGIPDYMTRDVAARLHEKAKLDPTRLAISASHTHTAPMLRNVIPTLFGRPIPADQLERIDRYTNELTDKLEQVALSALKALQPGTLETGSGTVEFSINRRTPGGPVDHDLPVMIARDAAGKIIAIYTSYACHCVTLSNNKLSGDWAGFAQSTIEKNKPGAIALTSVGCGADSNPSSGVTNDHVEIAEEQGKQIADEVDRVIKAGLTPLADPVATKLDRITLGFAKPPTREQFEQTAKRDDYEGYHARVQLQRLDRGEKLQSEISYPIQTWVFGKQLAMVFLPGEVVVDYSLRLKRELDASRLWINAYSNDLPCYIPSERILKEGGYEGGGAMMFYDRPTKLAPGLEKQIIDEVHKQLPDEFLAPKGTEGVAPRSPERSIQSFRTKPDLQVELVASEPLVTSPVAIDWAADGRLFVCEMFDYPTGVDQNWSPGGRIKVLTDTDHDGRYDDAKVFLQNIPFPTGVTAWGKGILVCAAPDILYAEDSDGDGKADRVEKLFTGFATGNYQARVNSLSLGLDNWIYGANGLLGGTITNDKGVNLDVRNHDFRFKTLAGPMELVTGNTQQGRVRDDFGRWFGCDNSNAVFYYPNEQRYLARNPNAAAGQQSTTPPANFDANRVYPVSRTLLRFNEPTSVNHITSACGLGIYRDTLLGDAYANNLFTCEPVHNLVQRAITQGDGRQLKRSRADDDKDTEFLASTDNWTRPVQVRTGPDGALYVVDMYRFLIEHPRWIPADRLAQLDVRAGADKGRIYRVRAKQRPLREVRDLSKLSAADLGAAMDSPNGTERDRVHVELLTRQDHAAAPALEKLSVSAALPSVRVQALCALDALASMKPNDLVAAMKDADPHVRANGIRLCEPLLKHGDAAAPADVLLSLQSDESPLVRRQLALTLGEWSDARAGAMLAKLATDSLNDPDLRVAVLSSSATHCGDVLAAVMATPRDASGREEWIAPLVATAAASKDDRLLSTAIAAVLPAADELPSGKHFAALAGLFDALERQKIDLGKLWDRPEQKEIRPRFKSAMKAAGEIAAKADAAETTRQAAIKLLGRGKVSADEITLLCEIASNGSAESVRAAALTALRRQSSPDIAAELLKRWQQTPPSARSDIASLLLSRDDWAETLLLAIKRKQIQPNEIPLADRQRLLTADSSIKRLAAEVFPAAAGSKNRVEVIARFSSVGSLVGAQPHGAELFAKNCAACHALNGVGNEIGPNLAGLRSKEPDYFVKNILDPSAVVEPRFVNYVVALGGGRVVAGVIKSEDTGSIVLATGGGGTAASIETISRADIKSIKATSISMMPEGFETALATPQDMADLIAFLKSGATFKQIAGNTPKVIEPDKTGVFLLGATSAEIYGEPIVLESEFKNIGYWSGRDDHVEWTLRVSKAGSYDVYLDYACAADAAGNRFAVDVVGKSLEGAVAATGQDWGQYKKTKVGTMHLDVGDQRLTVRSAAEVHGALMDLRHVALAPAGTKPTWPAVASPAARDELLRTPAAVAAVILDQSRSNEARQAVVTGNPQFAAELIVEMTKDLTSANEYERIPWIWRIAISCGKRNDPEQIKSVLDASVPQPSDLLRDWQAVVVGGGIINGISQQNIWPADRIGEIIKNDSALAERWTRSIELASKMADDEKIRPGTRYDALRMLGVEPWEKRGAQLSRYLATSVNGELQMGAVSGIADVKSPAATKTLLNGLPGLTPGNQNLALDALLRDRDRCLALLDAIEGKKISAETIGEARIAKLRSHDDAKIRERAIAIFAAAKH